MTAALVVSLLANLVLALLWRLSAASVRKLFDRWIRAQGQFVATDAELNALKIQHAQTLMQLEDARK